MSNTLIQKKSLSSQKHVIGVYDIINQILDSPRVGGKSKNNLIVRLIPEDNFDKSRDYHPLEDYLILNGITYYFEGDLPYDSKKHYDLDLRMIEIVYDKNPEILFKVALPQYT